MMIKLPSKRVINLLAFLICVGLMLFAIYLEVYEKINPCPLCIVQRIVVIILGILFFLAIWLSQNNRGTGYYYFFVALVSVLGAIVAGRQVWLQSLPADQVPACGASLEYMLERLPVGQVLQLIFRGTGECAKVTWRFLSLSIADWTLLFFIFFALVAIWQAMRKN